MRKLFSSDKVLIIPSIIVFVLVCYSLFWQMQPNDDNVSLRRDTENVYYIDSAEIINRKAEHVEFTKLPRVYNSVKTVRVLVDLKDMHPEGKFLMVSSSYCEVSCFVDNLQVFTHKSTSDPLFPSGGFGFSLIALPKEMQSKVVELRYKSRLPFEGGTKLNAYILGSPSGIFHELMYREYSGLIFGLALLFFFVVAVIFYLVARHRSKNKLQGADNKMLLLGAQALLLGVYYLVQCRSIWYLMRNYLGLVYILEYTSLILMYLPIITVLKTRLDKKFTVMFAALQYMVIGNLLVQFIAVHIGAAEFKTLLGVEYALTAVMVLCVLLAFIFTDGKVYTEKKSLMISVLPLLLTLVLNLAFFLVKGALYLELMFVTMCLFLAIQMIKAVREFFLLHEQRVQNVIFKTLALTDVLTQIGNRTAYINKIGELEEDRCDFWLLSFDFDGLKKINNSLGHAWGDKALLMFSECLQEEEASNPAVRGIFRVGGDEFALLLFESEDYVLEPMYERLNRKLQEKSEKVMDYKLGFSVGSYYHKGSQGARWHSTARAADMAMYRQKAERKAQGN